MTRVGAPRPVRYLMCGLAFSGKTTLARKLARRLTLVHVSLDQINAARGLPPGGSGLPAEEWGRSHALAERRLAAAFAAGRGAVLDDTGCFRRLRDRYRGLAARHGVPTTVVFVDTPPPEIRARMAQNASRATRPGMDGGVFERHLAEFQPPDPDEDVVRFTPRDEPLSWIAENLATG